MTKEAFEQLYIELLPGLYRLAVSILYHREDAMDAVQQTAEKAWRVSDRIQSGREKAYIVRIVINECRNIQRYRKRVVPRSDFAEERHTMKTRNCMPLYADFLRNTVFRC